MANQVRFQVSTRNSGRLRTIQVLVYSTVEEMRKAGEGFRQRNERDCAEGGLEGSHALAQSLQKLRVFKSGRTRRLPTAGYIRFYLSHLPAGTIVHESTHMAIAIYQQDVARTVPDMEREEKLCYLVGDITQRIVDKLYKLKLLKRKG